MPTYEYVCTKCDHQFEKFQSIADAPLRVCPEDLCRLKRWGKGRVKKLISAGAGLLFKGSGFYITDYRSEGYKQAAKQEASAGKPPGDGKAGGEGKAGGDGKAAGTSKAAPAKSARAAKAKE
jgi:putative FmdB family regulatory protein